MANVPFVWLSMELPLDDEAPGSAFPDDKDAAEFVVPTETGKLSSRYSPVCSPIACFHVTLGIGKPSARHTIDTACPKITL